LNLKRGLACIAVGIVTACSQLNVDVAPEAGPPDSSTNPSGAGDASPASGPHGVDGAPPGSTPAGADGPVSSGGGASNGSGPVDAPGASSPTACVPGTPSLCDGMSIKECQNDGTWRSSPCNRGCSAASCCGGDTEAVAGACRACGGDGQACCNIASPACGVGLVCVAAKCVVPCGDGPGQTCCEGHTVDCANNCGTGGVKVCHGGQYGSCSVANSCCGDRSCTNNCGETGTKPCNGTTLGACPVPRRECCPGDTKACSNSCGTATGTIACKNGKFNDSDCSVKNSPCPGAKGQPCRSGGGCDGGLFCCPDPGICNSTELNRCVARRGDGEKCNTEESDKECLATHYCNGDDDRCHRRAVVGETCGDDDVQGGVKCQAGLTCDPTTFTCVK
jgi:hypothetical protein